MRRHAVMLALNLALGGAGIVGVLSGEKAFVGMVFIAGFNLGRWVEFLIDERFREEDRAALRALRRRGS